MIGVTHSGEIEETFAWEMKRRFSKANAYAIGRREPKAWELIRYLPSNGRARFQETYIQPGVATCRLEQSVH